MKKTTIVSMVIFLVFAYHSAFAHHPWVEKEGNRFLIAWGHPPKVSPYEPKKVKDIKMFDLKGQIIAANSIDEKDKVYLTSTTDVSMITLSFEGGFLVTTPDGKKAMTKREAQKAGLQIVDSFYSNQFSKSLFGYSNAVGNPAGMKFEIVPLKNPLAVRDGELLPVKVLFEGKPLEGASIETGAHKEATKTNGDGIAEVKIMGRGLQVLLAKHRLSVKDNPDADYLSYTTVLTWEMK